MLQINHDMSYLYLDEGILKELGFTDITVKKIRFQGLYNVEGSKQVIKEILNYFEKTYKMYQYVKDNGVKFGDHELFYWSNGEGLYFTIDMNDNFSNEYNEKIIKDIERYIQANYSQAGLIIGFQYTNQINWDKLNSFINEYELDFDNIQFELLSRLYKECFYAGNRITKENKEKIFNIAETIQKHYKDKKVIFNGIKGTVKEYRPGYFGFFKPRQTKTCYPFELGNIKSLVIA